MFTYSYWLDELSAFDSLIRVYADSEDQVERLCTGLLYLAEQTAPRVDELSRKEIASAVFIRLMQLRGKWGDQWFFDRIGGMLEHAVGTVSLEKE